MFLFEIKSKEELAILLVVIMVVIVMAYFLLEVFLRNAKSKCSNKIWQANKKFLIYENQEELSISLYHHYTASLQSLVFIILIMAVLYYISHLMFLTLVAYWLIVGLILSFMFNRFQMQSLSIYDNLPKIINLFGLVSFLIIFIIIIVEFTINPSSISIVYAVIALILIRYLRQNITTYFQSLKFLFTKKEELFNIFFKHKVNHSVLNRMSQNYWELFKKDYHKTWIPNILADLLQRKVMCNRYKWCDLSLSNVCAIAIKADEEYLLKVFNTNLKTKALLESELFKQKNINQLILQFIGGKYMGMYACHLFKFNQYTFVDSIVFRSKKDEILKKIAAFELPMEFLNKYNKTHKTICDRITLETMSQVKIVVETESEKKLIYWFEDNLKAVLNLISSLPLRLVIPNIKEEHVVLNADYEPRLISVNGWKIEPIGYAFSTTQKERKILFELLNDKDQKKAIIVQLLKEYEMNLKKFNLRKALSVLGDIKQVSMELLYE